VLLLFLYFSLNNNVNKIDKNIKYETIIYV